MLKIENPRKRAIAQLLNGVIGLLCLPFLGGRRSGRQCARQPGNILVLRLDHIGDVIMSTAVYRTIKARYPASKVTVVVGRWGRPVLENNTSVDEVIVHDCPWWKTVRGEKPGWFRWLIKDYPALLKKIRTGGFDVGIDLRGDFRHILLFLFLGRVRYRLSYDRSGGEHLLDEAVAYEIGAHEIEKNFSLLREIHAQETDPERKRPEVFPAVKEREKTAAFLKARKVTNDILKVVVHPGAGNDLRRWPEERFTELVKWLTGELDAWVFLVGGEGERALIEMIMGRTPRTANLAGVLTILETAALIEKSNLFIGNDSAICHLASCFDVPLLVLYGPTDPERCKPYTPHLHYIYHGFPCSPCLQLRCVRRENMKGTCLEDITVEEVKECVRKIQGRRLELVQKRERTK